jgi:hypothetical protein
MELVVTGDLLDQGAVVFEQDVVAQVVEQHGRRQQAADQLLQFVEFTEWIERHSVDGAPLHESLGIGREGPQACLTAVGDDQDLVVLEGVRNQSPTRSS